MRRLEDETIRCDFRWCLTQVSAKNESLIQGYMCCNEDAT